MPIDLAIAARRPPHRAWHLLGEDPVVLVGLSMALSLLSALVGVAILYGDWRVLGFAIAIRVSLGLPIEAKIWHACREAHPRLARTHPRLLRTALLVGFEHSFGLVAALILTAPCWGITILALRSGQLVSVGILASFSTALALIIATAARGLLIGAPGAYVGNPALSLRQAIMLAYRQPRRVSRIRICLLALAGRGVATIFGLVGVVLATPWLIAAITLDPYICSQEGLE